MKEAQWATGQVLALAAPGLTTLLANQNLNLSDCRDFRGHLNSDTGQL